MTIRTISKRLTGGVTEKKDQLEWTTDGRSVDPAFFPVFEEPWARSVPGWHRAATRGGECSAATVSLRRITPLTRPVFILTVRAQIGIA
jgi:hypothetical protein